MKRYLTLWLLAGMIASAHAREVLPINEGWRFFFKSERTSDNARHVTLPHSWNTDPLAQGYWLETVGNYQNGMYIPAEWASKRLFVKFYGVQSVADVFVNGYHVGTHRGGGTAFTFEITDKIRFGTDNALLVMVNNRPRDDVLPTSTDMNLYGGNLPRSRTHRYGGDGHIAPLSRIGRRAGPSREVSAERTEGEIEVHLTSKLENHLLAQHRNYGPRRPAGLLETPEGQNRRKTRLRTLHRRGTRTLEPRAPGTLYTVTAAIGEETASRIGSSSGPDSDRSASPLRRVLRSTASERPCTAWSFITTMPSRAGLCLGGHAPCAVSLRPLRRAGLLV